MVRVRCLDRGLSFLKNLSERLKNEDEVVRIENIRRAGQYTSENIHKPERWYSKFDMKGLETCLVVLKTDVARANELIKYTTTTVLDFRSVI
jgi:hypothetical protein